MYALRLLLLVALPAGGLSHTSFRRELVPVVVPPTPRQETCRFCYRSCAVSCFVGTCGLEYGFNVKRYKFTNQCWTCDASASVGIAKSGDFTLCSADEAAATTTYLKKRTPYAIGPGIPGDARKAAQESSDAANAAMKSAQLAAQKADEAAKAAVAKFNAVGKKAEKSDEEIMEAHRIAETIRAQEASKAAEAAENARKIAEEKYNDELEAMRKQQLLTDRAEEIMQRSEKHAEEARAESTRAAARAAQAARDAAMSGAAAAGTAAEQAEADELANAARAAQRRAIIAAKAAKDAADKANIAANIAEIPPQPKPTLPPCQAFFLQIGNAATSSSSLRSRQQPGLDCEMPTPQLPPGSMDLPSTAGRPMSDQAAAAITGVNMPTSLAAAALQPSSSAGPSAGPSALPQSPAANAADAAIAAVPSIGAPEAMDPAVGGPDMPDLVPMGEVDPNQAIDNLSQGMADSLTTRLEANPSLVNNPQTFDTVSTIPNLNSQLMGSLPQSLVTSIGGAASAQTAINGGELPMNPADVPGVGDTLAVQAPGMALPALGMLQEGAGAPTHIQRILISLRGAGSEGPGVALLHLPESRL